MDEFLAELARLDQLAAAQNNYHKTLALLRALKAGVIALSEVRLTPDGWQVASLLARPVAMAEAAAEPVIQEAVPVSP